MQLTCWLRRWYLPVASVRRPWHAIVTGDTALLVLRQFREIRLLTLRTCLENP